MTLADLIVLAAAAGFGLMGALALALPVRVLSQFGVGSLTAAGRNEVRAVYGDFGLAVAGLLMLAGQAPDLRGGIVLTVGVAVLGMAGGRIVSALIDRQLARAPAAYLLLEAVFGAALLYAA